jgi:hypothetical protein
MSDANSKALNSTVAAVAPWAALGVGLYFLFKFFGKEGARAVGEVPGAALGGLFGGISDALGLDPNKTAGIKVVQTIPDGTEEGQTARIESPANNGTASRVPFRSTYTTRVMIRWNRDEAVALSFESKEYPRAVFDNQVTRKNFVVKLVRGRNFLDVEIPISGTFTLGMDIVLSVEVDGKASASSMFFVQ